MSRGRIGDLLVWNWYEIRASSTSSDRKMPPWLSRKSKNRDITGALPTGFSDKQVDLWVDRRKILTARSRKNGSTKQDPKDYHFMKLPDEIMPHRWKGLQRNMFSCREINSVNKRREIWGSSTSVRPQTDFQKDATAVHRHSWHAGLSLNKKGAANRNSCKCWFTSNIQCFNDSQKM